MAGNGTPAALAGIQLLRCSSAEELERAGIFRNHVFRSRRNVSFSEGLERRRDARGTVFLLLSGEQEVATARVQPFPSEISPVSDLAARFRDSGADTEVGRVAAVRSPDATRYSLLVLTLGAMWLLESTWHRRFVAYCHPKLLPLYQLVGVEVSGEPCEVPGRADLHHVIVGDYTDVASNGLRLLGISQAAAHAAIRWVPPLPGALSPISPPADRSSA